MRVLTISHSCVVGAYQDRMVELAKFPEIDLALLVPEVWNQFNKRIELEKKEDDSYKIIARQPFVFGFRSHVARNVVHVYPGMKGLLEWFAPDIIELWAEPYFAVTWRTISLARRINPNVKIIFFSAQNIYKKYPWPFGAFERYVLRNADFAFPCNEEARDVLLKKGFQGGTEIVPLAVSPRMFLPGREESLRRRLGLDAPVVGFFGKLVRQKGLLDLIDASSRMKKDHRLLFVGSGPLLGDMKKQLKKFGIEGRAVFVPAVPYEEVPELLRCCDIVTMPSITMPNVKEQFGRVLIEAMAAKVPVVGSDSGEIPKVLGDSGLIFPEGDSNKLAERIESLLSDDALRSEYAERGHWRVMENYTWAKVAEIQRGVYNKLLGRGSH